MAETQTQEQAEQAPEGAVYQPKSYEDFLARVDQEDGGDESREIFSFGQGLQNEMQARRPSKKDATGADAGNPAETQTAQNAEGQPKESTASDGGGAPGNDAGTASDGDGESGNNSNLPKGIRKRLAREKRRNLDLQDENQKLAERVKELEGQQAGSEGSTEPGDGTEPNAEETPAEGEETVDENLAPERDDYEDASEYLEDLDAWEQGLPLIHNPKKRKAETANASEEPSQETQPEEGEQSTAEPAAEERTEGQQLFDDIQETVEASMTDEDVTDEGDLWEDFVELMMQAQRGIKLSDTMVRYLADSEDAYTVVKTFVQKPVLSRRISRMGSKKDQIQAMEEIISGSAGGGDSSKAGSDANSNVPVMSPIKGSNPPAREIKLNEAKSFEEFNKMRDEIGEDAEKSQFRFRA